MAISTYYPTGQYNSNDTFGWTGLVNFLNSNKSGTFLKDATISCTNPDNENSWLVITHTVENNTESVRMLVASSLNSGSWWDHKHFTWSLNDVEIHALYYNPYQNNSYIYFKEAALCNHGLMIKIHWNNNASDKIGGVVFSITEDENGYFVLLTYPDTISSDAFRSSPPTSFNMYNAFSKEYNVSIQPLRIQPGTQSGQIEYTSLTCLKLAQFDSSIVSVPHAYVATATQITDEDFYYTHSTTIDGKGFITNAVIYFED